jgi:hypothetical protein
MSTITELQKIEKTKINRFFEFINPVSGQKDNGNMGIPTFNCVHGMGVEGRIGKCLADGIKTFGRINGKNHVFSTMGKDRQRYRRTKNGRPFRLQCNGLQKEFCRWVLADVLQDTISAYQTSLS